jgi:hypothetical protein
MFLGYGYNLLSIKRVFQLLKQFRRQKGLDQKAHV